MEKGNKEKKAQNVDGKRSRKKSATKLDGEVDCSKFDKKRKRIRLSLDDIGSSSIEHTNSSSAEERGKKRYKSKKHKRKEDHHHSKHRSKEKKKKKKKKEKRRSKESNDMRRRNVDPTKDASIVLCCESPVDDVIIGPTVCPNDGEKHEEQDYSVVKPTKMRRPMTKEEYDKKQAVVKRVLDPETGRERLIKGDGEILEEIVSYKQHLQINKRATRGDGEHFSSMIGLS